MRRESEIDNSKVGSIGLGQASIKVVTNWSPSGQQLDTKLSLSDRVKWTLSGFKVVTQLTASGQQVVT